MNDIETLNFKPFLQALYNQQKQEKKIVHLLAILLETEEPECARAIQKEARVLAELDQVVDKEKSRILAEKRSTIYKSLCESCLIGATYCIIADAQTVEEILEDDDDDYGY